MEPSVNNQSSSPAQPTPGRKRNIIIAVLVAIVIALLVLLRQQFTTGTTESKPAKKDPLFHRDEPAKEQIFQGDYEEKVKELLDSGKSVAEISRETGIRRDVIRKIKKDRGEKED